jgi:hypothetical protein
MPEYIYHKPMRYQVDAAEILKEIGEQPHMLLRISIRGGNFPHRNAPAFARIQDQRNTLHALYCEIDDDESGFRAYFATDIALKGILSVGFESDVVAEFELERLKLEPEKLEVRRIEIPFHRVTLEDPGVFKHQQ